ncbi:MAG: succinate dehydrogenase, cytochrome b556 subunit [Coxiellaceae bacterium]|nr:MAG: succinate dehydrogenase, cytochrome b556 subunit [Coxiellaceae bacterium]
MAVTKYRFPVTAIVSILHRISGVILFLLIPLLLWALSKSLTSAEDFQAMQETLSRPLPMIILWLILAALFYHLIAGIRHLIMDLGYGETMKAARRSAYIIMVITVILLILAGIWL